MAHKGKCAYGSGCNWWICRCIHWYADIQAQDETYEVCSGCSVDSGIMDNWNRLFWINSMSRMFLQNLEEGQEYSIISNLFDLSKYLLTSGK